MGALTSKLYSFQARPWELKKEKGYDPYEGKEVLFECRGLEVLRVLPHQGWISDKIRIVIDGFQSNRLSLSKKFNYKTGIRTEISFSSLGRIFSLLLRRVLPKKGSKRDFFFPYFFLIFPKEEMSWKREKRKGKWNYITS